MLLSLLASSLAFSNRNPWTSTWPSIPTALFGASTPKRQFRPRGSKKKSGQGSRQSSQPRTGSQPPKPRPLWTDYEANRNADINGQRLAQDIACPHFEKCSGCSVPGRVDQVDIVESARRFFSSTLVQSKRTAPRRGGPDDADYPVVVPSPLARWRTQAKLAVAPKSSTWARDGFVLGLYGRGTHNVLPIPDCMVHHPSINRAVALLEEASANVATPVATAADAGLRYVQLQVERITGRVCLTLVWKAASLKETHPHLTRLTKEAQRLDPEFWHSIWCNCNDGPGNSIFSRNVKRWHHLSGPEFVREPMAVGEHGWLYFSPLNFRQANLDGFDVLARDVAGEVPGGSRVCELYAGVGLLGLTALVYHADSKPLEWVRCSDENPSNPDSFQRAVRSLPARVTDRDTQNTRTKEDDVNEMTLAELSAMIESSGVDHLKTRHKAQKTSYMVASAEKALQAGQALGANVLIVDPPRKGLEPEVLSELCKPRVRNQPFVESSSALQLMIPEEKINWVNDVDILIYVSCGFDALARDTEELLTSNAGWMLYSASGYVLFPGSNHIETLCVFKRKLQ